MHCNVVFVKIQLACLTARLTGKDKLGLMKNDLKITPKP